MQGYYIKLENESIQEAIDDAFHPIPTLDQAKQVINEEDLIGEPLVILKVDVVYERDN